MLRQGMEQAKLEGLLGDVTLSVENLAQYLERNRDMAYADWLRSWVHDLQTEMSRRATIRDGR